MNKKYLIIIFCFIFAFLFLNSASATVGGPIYLSDFRYSEENGAIYFVENYTWWSKIIKHDVSILEKEEIAHYGQIMTMFPEGERAEIAGKYECPNDEYLESCVEGKQRIFFEKEKQKILDFAPLSRIDLAKNNIKINVSVAGQGEEGQYNQWGFTEVKFVANITQNNLAKGEIEFYGYYRDDVSADIAINFDSFFIPSAKTNLFLLGRRGQADEGGYLLEEVFFVDDLEISHPDPLPLRMQEKCLADRHLNECEDVLQDWFWKKAAVPTKGGLFAEFSFDERIDSSFVKEPVAQDHPNLIVGEELPGEDQLIDEAETRGPAEEIVDSRDRRGKAVMFILIAGAILVVAVLFLFYFKKKRLERGRNDADSPL